MIIPLPLPFRRKKAKINPDDKNLQVLIRKELEPYIRRDDVQDYLRKIRRDEHKKELWDGLSTRTKIKLLRYVLDKKGEEHGKR